MAILTLIDSAATGAAPVSAANPVPVTMSVSTTSSASRVLSAAASTNSTVAKASPGFLYRVVGYNAAATVRYLKIYNKATAPTVGTDTPILTIALKPLDAFNIEVNVYFSTGIGYALTLLSADADTSALTAADVLGLNVIYA
jgi:hypothetical protein